MKTVTLVIGLLLLNNLSAQTRYFLPSKTEHFSQGDWLEILSDVANDTQIVRDMKDNKSGLIRVRNKPYVCYVNEEHPVVFQFCPECVWIVDSCTSDGNVAVVALSARDDYDFHVQHVVVQDIWTPGDTVIALMYILYTPPHNPGQMNDCWLVPVASNMIIPGYSIFPNKKRKKSK